MSEQHKGIVDLTIEDSIKSSYLDYAMSVIVGRALPDVRDGLKPVHRRVLFAMNEMGCLHNKPYKKSARIVGDVIGKYHPHGDSAVYDTVVRMAQDFSLRYPLVDGQGNFGSIDGDSAAAMRYTEVRLSKIADEIMADIEKETVDFAENYDSSLVEPTVMPTRIPNLLINGSSGIAVGMATNIPPHNLREIVDALILLIDNPNATEDDIFGIVKGPDFPTRAMIMGRSEIYNAYRTGRGSVRIRARAEIEEKKSGKVSIIITEIPYQVNKAQTIEKIAELVRDKKVIGITDLRDESDWEGIRVVIEVKKGENPEVILNQLYKYTQLENSFGVNMVALVDGRPMQLTLMRILEEFIKHRVTVVTRRTRHLLAKAEARLHILEGLRIAVENIDAVVELIKKSPDSPTAKQRLCERFALTEIQAQSILDMRLAKLTGLEIDKLLAEYEQVLKDIEYYKSILNSREVLMGIIKDELIEVRDNYGDERRTEICDAVEDINIEDLIADDPTVVTMTHNGYIKRTLLSNFNAQRRGGKGKTGQTSREDDFVENIIITSNHSRLLIFTNTGKIHYLKVYEIPESAPGTKGRHFSNLVNMEKEERVASILSVSKKEEMKCIFMGTKQGVVKRTLAAEFSSGRSGIIAIGLRDGDEIITALLTDENDNVLISTRNGKAIQFSCQDVRTMGRAATGVRGILLEGDDEVVALETIGEESREILTVTMKGYGKRSPIDDYRVQTRGGKGIKLCRITPKTGKASGAKIVTPEDEVMLITRNGKTIRLSVADISHMGRDTQGVKLMDTGDDEIVSFAIVRDEEQE